MEIRVMDMSLALKDLIGPGIAVIALAIGLLQYRSTSHTEFIKPLREMQLRLYQEASSAAAQIVSLQPQSPEWTKAKQNFLTLYYGPMAILEEFDHAAGGGDEHLSVEEAMILFKSCMDDAVQGIRHQPYGPQSGACAYLQRSAGARVGIRPETAERRLSKACYRISKQITVQAKRIKDSKVDAASSEFIRDKPSTSDDRCRAVPIARRFSAVIFCDRNISYDMTATACR